MRKTKQENRRLFAMMTSGFNTRICEARADGCDAVEQIDKTRTAPG